MPLFSRKSSSSKAHHPPAPAPPATPPGDADHEGNTGNESSLAASTTSSRSTSNSKSGGAGARRSLAGKLSRSASALSTKSANSTSSTHNNKQQQVTTAALLNSFTSATDANADTPASRRVPSSTSSSFGGGGGGGGSAASASASTSTSTSASGVSAASSLSHLTPLSTTNTTSGPLPPSSGAAEESGSIPSDDPTRVHDPQFRHHRGEAVESPASSENGDAIQARESVKEVEDEEDEDSDSSDEFIDAQEVQDVPASSSLQQAGGRVGGTATHESSLTPEGAAKLAVPVTSDTPLQADLRQIWYAITLFLNSKFPEAEGICEQHREDRLYYSLGSATLTSIKALMSFEPEQLAHAVELCKKCLHLADKARNDWTSSGSGHRGWSITEKIAGGYGSFTRGSSLTVDIVQRMSPLQRHAELAYAECLLLKAIVALMYSGDFLAFLKEAFNMRSAHAVYKVLRKFVQVADEAHPSHYDPTLDLDFRSGVEFGNGCSSLILSLLPSTAVRIVEMFGFSSNREEALAMLMRSGGWTKTGRDPAIGEGPGKEGLRRSVCDLVLLTYHLIISSFIPIPNVDIPLAERILHYNLTRYPDGVFFLYFAGRLYSTQTRSTLAIQQYDKALEVQKGAGASFKQIQYIVRWDLSLTYLSLGDYAQAHENLSILAENSKWSKAVYSYGQATTMYEDLLQKEADASIEAADLSIKQHQVREIMKSIPAYVQRIAGKSLPFEKFVARKSKKFLAQDGRLALAGLELAYMLSCLQLAPRSAIYRNHVRQVRSCLADLEDSKGDGSTDLPTGWWDDYCLAHLLHGVLLHYWFLPDPQVKAEIMEPPMSVEAATAVMLNSFRTVIENTVKLELDHHVAYLAHFELARLLAKLGPEHHEEAQQHLTLLLDGKIPFGPSKGKGKVSMQNGIILKANAALEQLKAKGKA